MTTQCGSAVVHSGRIARGDGSIFLERRLQRAQDFDRRILARPLVFVENRRRSAFLLCRDLYRHDLRLEPALFDRGDRLAVRVHRKLILLFARDAILFRNVLARDSHVVVVVDIPKPVVHHRVDHLRVSQTVSLARLWQKIRSVGHRFHSARHDDRTVSCLHRLRCERDGFQS